MATNWKKIITSILNAEPPRGAQRYTLEMLQKKTGINKSTLSRLKTQPERLLDYDAGVLLMKLYDELKDAGKLSK